ncbi:aryl-sulfate sulfotransferase [Halomicrococcus gelatinilyticus]|uniref:aryl-sulfate sulfotransferase n=1 Tax=Halomicrococcus gelatinilyticus TaxID=1702103 RepID=UPI002E12C92F
MSSDVSPRSWLAVPGRRAKLLAVVGVALLAVAAVGALAAPAQPRLTVDENRPQNNTLVALQGYEDEGRAIEVTPGGEVVWEYADADDVFDVEALGDGRVQVAVADELPDSQCPAPYGDDGYDNCVRNALRIVDKETKETLWEYAWFDAKLHAHELHDADRYVVDGEPHWVLVDMGNDRVFAVNRSKEIVWQWNATERYDRPDGMGPEGDWTHMNDVDRVGRDTFRVSLRNFDTVVDLHVDRNATDDAGGTSGTASAVTVDPVVGPDDYHERGDVLHEQHNPDTLDDGTLLVADSENDRVVELNASTGAIEWEYGGSATFDWPRDADRLPNGHTLVADSYNDRVVEVDENGEVVWAVSTGALPYEADRLPGEGSDGPTAREAGLPNQTSDAGVVRERAAWAVSMVKYVAPDRLAEQSFLLVGGLLALLGAGVERWRSRRE